MTKLHRVTIIYPQELSGKLSQKPDQITRLSCLEQAKIGSVVLKSGTLTLESGGDVWIDEGIIIENGATLIIEYKGNVTISGGTVERGGSLRIDAGGEIMIQKGFEAKIGANVEFK